MKIDKYRTDGEICQWVSKICFAYSINSTVSVGSAKLCNHHFLNDGGKMCVFIQCITIPVHRFKIPNVFPIGLSFHGKSFSHSVFFIFFMSYECSACAFSYVYLCLCFTLVTSRWRLWLEEMWCCGKDSCRLSSAVPLCWELLQSSVSTGKVMFSHYSQNSEIIAVIVI